ncbi:hypothetical protein SAMN06295905_1923 [Devosia lucknowensis]|uniref:UrcA family protein n=1 Tax=Devosia lucknowensis TaxID=1096929 RepID=A0A1Y6FDS7_9HYPH|nr:hypothetical protein [Devosia lucknowensis]SMQ70982.1 hypothetical protein SAMN06295905_1923 [Devosia lucknowensis]
MRSLSVLALAATLMTAPAALAQDSVAVDLSYIGARLATELGIAPTDLPARVTVSRAIAADVCGIEDSRLGTGCRAIVTSPALLLAVELIVGDGNSARSFAPGQQDGPARDFAPGQQDGPARNSAPGQLKKN